jgi:hypothetical protein
MRLSEAEPQRTGKIPLGKVAARRIKQPNMGRFFLKPPHKNPSPYFLFRAWF